MGGYTVIEVMLFLAISGVIFAGAAYVFSGQQNKTSFEQGMRDLSSQLQKYVGEVSTSVFTGGANYTCTVSAGGRAQLNAGSPGQGTNQACIFLGRAIQVVPNQQKVYIYSVLGNKNTSNNESVTSFADAMPEPAISADADLTEEYFTSWGKVSSAKITTTSDIKSTSTLVGFYNSLQDGYQNSGVAGAQSVFAKGYSYQNSDPLNPKMGVKSCIEEQNPDGTACTSTNAPIIKNWVICFASTRSAQTALLTLTSHPAGITTEVNFTSCS